MEQKTLEEVLKGAPVGSTAYFDGTGGWDSPRKFKKKSTGWESKQAPPSEGDSSYMAIKEDNSCTVVNNEGKLLWPIVLSKEISAEPEPKLYNNPELAPMESVLISHIKWCKVKKPSGDWQQGSGVCSANVMNRWFDPEKECIILPSEFDAVKEFLDAHRRLQDG